MYDVVFEGDIPHSEKITPCVFHSHVSLMPMSLSCLCLSHFYVSPIPLSISFPCLSYSPVSLIPMSLSIPGQFPCLSHSHVSLMPMSLAFLCLSHSPVYLIPVSLIPPSLSFLCLSPSFASSILMSHFHVFPNPMSVLNNPPSLAIFHHGLMGDIPLSLCFPEPLG